MKSLTMLYYDNSFNLFSRQRIRYLGCFRIDDKLCRWEKYNYNTTTVMWIDIVPNYVGILSKTECPLPLPKAKEWV
jgi:hypothetical protein